MATACIIHASQYTITTWRLLCIVVTAIALRVNNLSCVYGATPTYKLMAEVVEKQASLYD